MSLVTTHKSSGASAEALAKPVVNIAVITPKPETFDAFMAMQLAQRDRLRGKVQGLLGSRFYRASDDRTVVLISTFETAEDSQRFREDPRFTDHLARVRPLIESATLGTYETAYELGAI
jgi:heme-degrading monooxygenase HmoA